MIYRCVHPFNLERRALLFEFKIFIAKKCHKVSLNKQILKSRMIFYLKSNVLSSLHDVENSNFNMFILISLIVSFVAKFIPLVLLCFFFFAVFSTALSTRIIDRIFSRTRNKGRNSQCQDGRMGYTDFVIFLLAEEDKNHPRAIEYWFR